MTMPDPAELFAMIAFGAIGGAALLYGKRVSNMRAMAIGAALCGYPFVVSGTLMLYVVGLALTALLVLWRR